MTTAATFTDQLDAQQPVFVYLLDRSPKGLDHARTLFDKYRGTFGGVLANLTVVEPIISDRQPALATGLKTIPRGMKDLRSIVKNGRADFSLIATPAESLSGRFVSLDKGKFGSIPGITDRDYYTNSFHVPVYCHIKAFKKIEIEAPYHELTNAGHITYVELDGDTCKNPEAFERIIRFMHDHGVGYGSVNHPLDRDPLCGYVGVINDCCPRCGRKEGEGVSAELLDELRKKYPHIPQWS